MHIISSHCSMSMPVADSMPADFEDQPYMHARLSDRISRHNGGMAQLPFIHPFSSFGSRRAAQRPAICTSWQRIRSALSQPLLRVHIRDGLTHAHQGTQRVCSPRAPSAAARCSCQRPLLRPRRSLRAAPSPRPPTFGSYILCIRRRAVWQEAPRHNVCARGANKGARRLRGGACVHAHQGLICQS